MKRFTLPLLSATLLAGVAGAQVTDPNTGSTYQVFGTSLDWAAARVEATTKTFNNQPGRLATINNQAELDFILNNLAISRPWLGAFHDATDPNYAEPADGWVWITGEPFSFTNWFPGEPNNTAANGGPEDYLEMFASGEWNDTNLTGAPWVNTYLVEWEPGGSIGSNYCGPANLNSSGLPARLTAIGSDVAASNNVRLGANQMAQHQFGMFVNSMAQGFVTPPGSQGNLCLSGGIGRYKQDIMSTGPNGVFALQLDLTNTPTPGGPVAIQAGESWYFQAWFRDTNPGSTSNFTDGICITFL